MPGIRNSRGEDIGVRKVHPSLGYCIYCYTTKGKLTDEHAFPDGMGGRHILKRASCQSCQEKINDAEQYCMRTLFGNVRGHLGIRSSKARKRPPVNPSVLVKKGDGIERIYRPIEELPLFVTLPVLPLPFVLHNLPGPTEFKGQSWKYHRQAEGDLAGVTVQIEVDHDRFARMLAKIAHSIAVAELGASTFKHRLPPIILGEQINYIEYVGGSLNIEPPSAATHEISLYKIDRESDRKPFIMVEIRLFGSLLSPTYYVVVGELITELPLLLDAGSPTVLPRSPDTTV